MSRKLIVLFFLLVISAQVYPYSPEEILSYHSYIQVHEDSSMTVTETITVKSTGDQIKHGIYRDFPTKYKDALGNRYIVEFEVQEVLRDYEPEMYSLKNLSNGKRVYIGNKDYVLHPGEHTFTLMYKTSRQLGFFENYDELYWNVTGNGWAFPIDRVTATVELPNNANRNIQWINAYTGPEGSQGKNFMASTDMHDNAMFTTTMPLGKEEGLTIVVQWSKDFVREPTLKMKIGYLIKDNRGFLIGFAGLLLLLAYYIIIWHQVGRDPERGTIIPLYKPPEKFSPASIRYIIQMGYDNRVFAASVINMAVKGYLTIEEEDNKYTLRKKGADEKVLTSEEKIIACKLFRGNLSSIEMDKINHMRIRNAMVKFRRSLKNNFEKIYFFTNQEYFISGIALSVLVMILSVIFSDAGKLPIAVFMSVWLSLWSLAITALLKNVLSLWKDVLFGDSNRLFSLGGAIFSTLFAIPFVAGEIIGIGIFMYATSVPIIILLALMVFINFLFYSLLKAPTIKGRRIMDQIEGFKMYLSVAEKDRLNLMNPPEKTPELFEKYLPFALALDVEQQWSEQFLDVLLRAVSEGKEYRPGWYSGAAWSSVGAAGFATSIGSSFSSAISSSSHAPGSSSGGSGGSSGGGGGGGGGGGW